MDIVGERGEALFRVAITKWCGGEPWFEVVFQGEKAEALDFEVRLRDSTVFQAVFYVQVKATAKNIRYAGTGKDRKLLVRLKVKDGKKLGRMKVPAFVVGIDVHSGACYLKHMPAGTKKGFEGMSTRHPVGLSGHQKIVGESEGVLELPPARDDEFLRRSDEPNRQRGHGRKAG